MEKVNFGQKLVAERVRASDKSQLLDFVQFFSSILFISLCLSI